MRAGRALCSIQPQPAPAENIYETMQNECDTCAYFAFDEEYGDYLCEIDMDEDEYARLLTDSHYSCPYYRNGDDYAVVRHQM